MYNTEKKFARLILGKVTEQDCFTIKHWGMSFNLSIKPVSCKKIIRISGILSHVKEIKDEGQSGLVAMMDNSENLKYFCKVLAVSTGSFFTFFVYKLLMKLSTEEIKTLWSIYLKNSDPTFFLTITASVGKMNLLKPKAE